MGRSTWIFAAGAAVAACHFDPAEPANTGDRDAAAVDGPRSPDATVDAWIESGILYAGSPSALYTVDLIARDATLVGYLVEQSTSLVLYFNDIARDGDSLIGITGPPTTLYRINRATAIATMISTLDLDDDYLGGTAAPAGELEAGTVLFLGTLDGALVRVDVTTGHVTPLGAFGGGNTVSGDLVWVRGAGLYATVNGPGCDDCLATLSTTTGQATVIRNTGLYDLFAAASVNGRLFVFQGGGAIHELDPTTGTELDSWALPGYWAIAAP